MEHVILVIIFDYRFTILVPHTVISMEHVILVIFVGL